MSDGIVAVRDELPQFTCGRAPSANSEAGNKAVPTWSNTIRTPTVGEFEPSQRRRLCGC
jgi:hypothetical protein